MYNNYNYPLNNSPYPSNYQTSYPSYDNQGNDRFIAGGLLAPFLLGGLAGAAIAPTFYPRPYYPAYQPFQPYPCCYPRFW